MGVRLFSKRSLRFSHEINHLEVIYADLISQRRGEGYFCKDSPRVRGYTERVKEEKPGQKVLWVLIRRTSGPCAVTRVHLR